MIHLKINGKKKIVPTSWDEVTVAVAEKIAKADPDQPLSAVGAILGEEITDKTECTRTTLSVISRVGKFLQTAPPSVPVPAFVRVAYQQIDTSDVEALPFGAYQDMLSFLQRNNEESAGKTVVAIWMCAKLEKVYDFEKVAKYLPWVDRMPYLEFQAVLDFFLKSLAELKNGTPITPPNRSGIPSKLWQGFRSWIASVSSTAFLGYVLRSTTRGRMF